jgi:glycerophosphoryl diester phosphodiesterase
LGAISTDDVSIALSDKRSASRAHYLKSPDIHPQILLKLKRDVPPPMGLHLDVFSLRANPNLLADALQFKIPVFTYSMRGDDFHTSELKQHLQRTNMPSGAIIDGTPQDFCRKMAS